MKYYDVIIVGAGPMGIFTAYELKQKAAHLNILLIDKGQDVNHRHCPIIEGKLKQCPTDKTGYLGCKPCGMTCGFGGSGAFSDGKFNITSEFGGWLKEFIGEDELLDLIHYVDSINLKFGAPDNLTDPDTKEVRDIEHRGIAKGLKLLRSHVRHVGTEINLKVLDNIAKDMADVVDYLFLTDVDDVLVEKDTVKGVLLKDGSKILGDYVVLGVGRNGASWLVDSLLKHNVRFTNNRVDIGVRVETNDIVMQEINQYLYEGKFIYNTSVGTRVRTFCSNPSGHVVIENNNGVAVVNGHSFNDPKLASKNTNFALLVSHHFEDPFKDPNEYAMEIARLANKLSNGSVIVQKYGDIKRHRRSTYKRLSEGFVKPTLKEAIPGDLGLVLPYNTMQSILDMVEALDTVTPGIANDHTLFYGVEAKFYSDRPEIDDHFEVKVINRLYVGGDGAGLTRGLAQAGANGIYVAREIIKKARKA